MTITDDGGWSPQTADDKAKAAATFVVGVSLWLPFLGLLAGLGARAFMWGAGL